MTQLFDTFWMNGEFLSLENSNISPFDRGLTLGDGLFETCLWESHNVVRLAEHRERLASSCRVFAFPLPPSTEAFSLLIEQLVQLNRKKFVIRDLDSRIYKDSKTSHQISGDFPEKLVIRITLSRGEGERGLELPDPGKPWVMITLSLIPRMKTSMALGMISDKADFKLQERAQNSCIRSEGFDFRRNRFSLASYHKTLNYMDAIMVFREAKKQGVEDILLLDDRGYLACTSLANLFLVKGNTLLTPSLECAILPGITRAFIIKAAQGLKIPVQETLLKFEDLKKVDAVFLSNSIRGILPVRSVNTLLFSSEQNVLIKKLRRQTQIC